MTKAQLAKLERLDAARARANKLFQEYKASIKSVCDHPTEYRSNHQHSRSNGYGRWSTENMPHCTICDLVQYNSAYNYKWGEIPVNKYED